MLNPLRLQEGPFVFKAVYICVFCRYNGSIDSLKRTQSDSMGKWRKQAEAMCDWLDRMEDQLDPLDTQSGDRDAENIYGTLEECEV